MDPEIRFLSHTRLRDDGCLVWTAALDRDGYATAFWDGERKVRAYRWAYEHFTGKSIVHQIDHTCHDPEVCPGGRSCPHRPCVNWRHLVDATSTENTMRGNSPHGRNARATHCVNGHEFTPENTLPRKDHKGRACRACLKDRSERWAAENRDKLLALRKGYRAAKKAQGHTPPPPK